MSISSLINENLIDLDLKAENQKETIEKLVDMLMKQKKIKSKKEFIEGVLLREKEATTGFGNGIAIPHCKDDSVLEASIAIGKLKKGVEWNSLDGNPVELIILLAVPSKEANTTHLEVLSKLASKLMDKDFTYKLLNIKSKGELINLLNE
jgi:fructose-specific phosphotransferase system IIA component